MASHNQPQSAAERPLWIIALSLLTIAFCLLFFVIQTFLHDPPDQQAAQPTLPRRRISNGDPPARPFPPAPVYAAKAVAPAPPPPVAPETAPAPDPRLLPPDPPPVPAPKPVRASASLGGYAPLSYLGQTNYNTALIGKVVLHGTPPVEQPLDLSRYAYCLSLQPKPLTTRFFVVGPEGGLADVLVFIREGLPRRLPRMPQPPCALQFTNCQIQPYVSAIAPDQPLLLGNGDGIAHRLRITPSRGREMISQIYYGSSASLLLPSRAELFIPCRCEMHPWETAYVSKLDHPFFAVTAPDGKFAISNVPPGTYVLVALHRKAQGTNGIAKQFTLAAGQTITANFVIEAPPSPQAAAF